MHFQSVFRPLLLALACGSFSLTAFAQWQWIDKDGRKVYSDRSPPADILEKNILKRPGGMARTAAAADPAPSAADPAAPAASAPAGKASAPRLLSGKDKDLEAKKKQAETEEAAKKKAEEEKIAKAKAENCDNAKRNMATLQSGVRITAVNGKGEREGMDDTKRAAEVKRVQEAIDSSCK